MLQGNATHAAQDAGYAPGSCRNQGYRLMGRPAIRARVAEIRAGLARAFCLDAVVLMGKLEAVYQRANENHAFNAAARAVEIQARIAGHVAGPKYLRPNVTRGENGTLESGGDPRNPLGPDREKIKMTNDDGGAPNSDGNAAVLGR